jgi:uncharacterized protein
MNEAFQSIFWGAGLRVAQASVDAAPTLLCGLIIAGILRRMMAPDDVRWLFGSTGWQGIVRAWGLGMILPVCSLGAIPVIRELRRVGVPGDRILVFALSAPLLNPLSLLYGLTLSEPLVILSFVAGSLVVALVGGLAWERWFARPGDTIAEEAEPPAPPGLRRLAAVIVAASNELVGPTLGYCLIGLLGVALLAAIVPFGSLQHSMSHKSPLSPALMVLIALPAYSSPMKTMMRLGLMFEHGNSVGAAYILLTLGAGATLGLVAWMVQVYGYRRTLTWLAIVMVATLSLSYLAEYPLYFAVHEEEHTHAFDDFASPFPHNAGPSAMSMAIQKLEAEKQLHEILALYSLLVLAGFGLLVRLLGNYVAIDSYLAQRPLAREEPVSRWNRPIPGRVLALIVLAGLVVASALGAFVYYPDARTLFSEMSTVKAEALSAVMAGEKERAIREIRRWDDLSRKLEVGVVLRQWHLDDEARKRTEDLRERLEDMRDALIANDVDKARRMIPLVQKQHFSCRQAFLGGASNPYESQVPDGPPTSQWSDGAPR